ncbi:DUF1624 domain-containing protein [Klebsiella oxytoca]|uniref:heparan-alpha-glucosaminide N-acetyltransferase domain-containing protein n=1 Tax=Klebsiella oxytoca TaxID=571 RepID=UPI0013D3D90B|nr:heparan-alpha-glucosaminide N-acetyltransferase domain-containing protein [Klebsiella oxytoca]ELK0736409.1 DUF1624 domain-containing protein [Klebsiella oxytoca]ELX8406715.1 DUF1624 domain-containing protein [Klebsiella oxytoca]MBZ7693303.1 DUF1624 domain-containing protein [Klebsiella oxytoca]MDM4573478.1 heparan-alpha-glucosaminide N-acetyltransferase domain-containing protein [Klebsiella oxytoca]MDS7880411.1 heparan-alpha-glucosaminide N-acetyltransferase domain-containing protein [Klebs
MKITRNQDIDRMRGLTVYLMLVVNSPVDLRITNSALIHSEWAGLSLADTVFPTFLFIVGISLTLSNRLKKITLRGLFIRSTVLVLTGIFLKAIVFVLYDQEHFKIMGVLQRIGICYGVTGLIYHFISNKKLPALCLALILAWSAILMIWGDYNQYANISDVVDDLLLGAHANYYNTDTGRSGDSEGVLSTLGALVTTLSGVIFGEQINKISDARGFCYGMVCIITGFVLAYYFSIPIVKKLWTPSFLLICVGIAIWLYLLVKRMAVIDLTWLEYPGKHSLAIYVISVIAFDVLLYCHVWHSLFVAVYTWLIPRSIPLQGATLFFSVLFSSIICFTPYLIQKTMFFVKRAI